MVVRLATNLAIPGWATYTAGMSLIVLVQLIMAAFVFSFMILGSRHGSTFLPRRDDSYFVAGLWTLNGPERAATPLPVPEMATGIFV